MKTIKLTQGKYALIDDEDFERLNQVKWHSHEDKNTWYAARSEYINGRQKTIRMHRLIMNAPPDKQVDHRDGNGLNNQKGNLRYATNLQNTRNQKPLIGRSSKYKGVCWDKQHKKWMAYIMVNGKQTYLGYFDDEILAAQTYNLAAKMHFGEFAWLNDIK